MYSGTNFINQLELLFSKDFLVISVYYKCFAGLFYRNDVLISIVSVHKTIHNVMLFFTIALPSGFYYEKTELLSQEVSGPVISYATILFAMYIFQVCLH